MKYSTLFCLLMVVVAVFLSSFSPGFYTSALTDAPPIPIYNSIRVFHTEVYEPEFDLKIDSFVIPLKRAGRLFLIEAKVDNEEGNLIFDTGASGLVLNSTYFRNYIKTETKNSSGINGAVGLVEKISVGKLEFAKLSYKNLWADLVSLGHIENRRGVKILGLVGFGMMRNFEIVLDSKNNELKLFRIDKTGKRLNSQSPEFKSDYNQKIEGNGNILFLKGMIGGKMLNFGFDSGAETNAISSFSNKKIMSTITITRRMTLKGAGASGREVLFGRMNDFTIGPRQILNMETIITNLAALSDVYGTHIDGMLGYSFLEHGTICVNFVKKQFGIRFWKGDDK
ncbi:MAG TPA: aspartyl protease family protein [Prolixibacteraceae bacterium]|nr:aspartyl protease family protein [Prolixibacteraceae bacterium]